MIKIKYEIDGQEIDIEVEDGVGKAYIEIQAETKRENERDKWRRRKKLTSIEEMAEHDIQIADGGKPIDEQLIEKEDKLMLHKALEQLSPKQQELVQKIYFEGKSQIDIAKEENVDKSAITHRLETIFRKLKKLL